MIHRVSLKDKWIATEQAFLTETQLYRTGHYRTHCATGHTLSSIADITCVRIRKIAKPAGMYPLSTRNGDMKINKAGEKRRKAILDAAWSLFLEKGYAAVNVDLEEVISGYRQEELFQMPTCHVPAALSVSNLR
jgi:hypothetical protein